MLVLSVSACNSSARRISPSASASPTLSAIPITTFTLTSTPKPTNTHVPTITLTPTPIHTNTPTPKSTKSLFAQPTKSSTPKALLTPTNTPAPSDTTTPIVSIQQKCVTIEDHFPDNINTSGSLLLYDWTTPKWSIFNFQLRQRLSSPFPTSITPFDYYPFAVSEARLAEYAFSPDAKWMAYIEIAFDDSGLRTKARYLRLMSVDGRKQDLSYWSIDWQWIIGWIDNQRIALLIPGFANGTVVVLKPFTGQWQ